MDLDFLLNSFAILVVTIDPIALGPMFLGITSGMTLKQQRQVALRATIVAVIILTVFFLFGEYILKLLGISIDAFRLAGGLLLLFIGFEIVFEKRDERRSKSVGKAMSDETAHSKAIFPLAIPLMAGPGAITAVMLLASDTRSDYTTMGYVFGVICFVLLLCLAATLAASQLDRFISSSARQVVSRLLGVILTALAVQFVIDGIKGAFL